MTPDTLVGAAAVRAAGRHICGRYRYQLSTEPEHAEGVCDSCRRQIEPALLAAFPHLLASYLAGVAMVAEDDPRAAEAVLVGLAPPSASGVVLAAIERIKRQAEHDVTVRLMGRKQAEALGADVTSAVPCGSEPVSEDKAAA